MTFFSDWRLSCDFYRLYYLFQGPRVTFITEDSAMKFLYWYSPILSGLTMTLHIIESLMLYSDKPMLFHYSFCKKTPFSSDLYDNVHIMKIGVTIIMIPSMIAEMCIHIAVLVKQTQIENNASVYIVKNDQRVSRQRHQRNVVSAMGHFGSFAFRMLETFLVIHAFYFIDDFETLTIAWNLSMFFIPSINFFIYPFIETLFSNNLLEGFSMSLRTGNA